MFRLIALQVLFILTTTSAWAGLEEAYVALRKSDYASALRELRPLAIQGDAAAQLEMGEMYKYGRGVPSDLKEAAKWYRLAAVQGTGRRNIDAKDFLCWLYYDHSKSAGIEPKEGLKWCRTAAAYGNLDALFTLGLIFERGVGVIQDRVLAYAIYNIYDKVNRDRHGEPTNKRLEPDMSPEQIASANALTNKMVEGQGAFIRTLDQYLNNKKPAELYANPDIKVSDMIAPAKPVSPITPEALNGAWVLDLKATEKYITGLPQVKNADQVAQGIGLAGGFLLAMVYEFKGDTATVRTFNRSSGNREYKCLPIQNGGITCTSIKPMGPDDSFNVSIVKDNAISIIFPREPELNYLIWTREKVDSRQSAAVAIQERIKNSKEPFEHIMKYLNSQTPR